MAPLIHALEPRLLLAFDPSGREQQLLELLNRMRMAPAAEINLLLNSSNTDVANGLTVFEVNTDVLRQQWAGLTPQAPLAWNTALATAAGTHNALMLADDQQSHQLPGESNLGDRLHAAGYNYTQGGENVYAYAKSVLHCHAGFAIDWGNGANGLQDPPEHRENMMSDVYREVGISIIDSTPDKLTGPLLVTEEFGARAQQDPYLLGVVYRDANRDGAYTAGEGVGGVQIRITGNGHTYNTTSMSAGGYQFQLPAGDYSVSYDGPTLGATVVHNVTVAANNVKVDVQAQGLGQSSVAPHAGANAMATNSAGKLYLAWYDTSSHSLKFARRMPSGTWSAPATIDASGDVGRNVSLAIGADDLPSVAYYNATRGELDYAHFNGRLWSKTVIDRGRVGVAPSLAFDLAGHPGITYYDTAHKDLRFARNGGMKWAIGVIESLGDAGSASSLRFDTYTGHWTVAYTNLTTHSINLGVRGDSGWVRTPAAAGHDGKYLGLAFDPSTQQPAITYFDTKTLRLHWAQFDGSAWNDATAAASPAGSYAAGWFDADTGAPQVIYYNRNDGGLYRATSVGGGGWIQSALGAGGGMNAAVALGPGTAVSYTWIDSRTGALYVRDL